jgi:LCP family protein required for cell wall assembly
MKILKHNLKKRWLFGALAVLLVAVVGYGAFEVVKLESAWASVDRVSLAAPAGSQQGPLPEATPTTDPPPTTTTSTPQILTQASPAPSVMLLVGSDSRAGLQDTTNFGNFTGQRADVIVLAIRKADRLVLLSVPRDLYVPDTCHGGQHRINDAFTGCGDTNGLAQLAKELESVTGLTIDHAVAVDLAGFPNVVDQLGGYQICTDYPLRDSKSGLNLAAGCTQADGAVTLQWIRSRHTEQLVNGSWQIVPGVSDLTRNSREREFLMDMLHRESQLRDPRSILDTIQSVAPYLTIDDQLSLTDASAWLWDFRNAAVKTDEIPVTETTTATGADVLLPTVDIPSFVAGL